MSEQEEYAGYTLTLKFGGAFPDPWLVVRADDESDLSDMVTALKGSVIAKDIVTIAKEFHGLYLEGVEDEKPAKSSRRSSRSDDDEEKEERPARRSSTSSRGRGTSTRQASRNDDGQGEEHPEGVECDKCGEVLVYKSGVSQAGNNYALWTCPNGKRKGDGHSSEYVN